MKTTDDGVAVTVEGGDVIEAELLLVAVGPRPGRPRASATTSRASRWTAASCSPTSGAAPTSRACTPSATSSPASSSRTAASSRASSWPRTSPASPPRRSTRPASRGSPTPTPRSPRSGSPRRRPAEQYGADAVETLTYDLGGNGKSQILKTQGFVKLVRRKDGPVVGVHLVGDRVGELIGEAQLIYNWEAHAEDVAPLVHAHPTQNEALGEAHLALAGKPLHAHS